MMVCVGWVFSSAGIEGWGDRHGRTPGSPQTWRETQGKLGEKKRNILDPYLIRHCFIRGVLCFMCQVYSLSPCLTRP